MKHRLFTSLLTITATLTAMAQATQPCVVKQYNQKRAKTPLAGVQVEVRDAATKVSDNAGLLTLQFNTQKAGDRVTMRRITKTGYEIFNKTSIEQWNISRDQKPFEIVLVSSDVFSQLKNNLTQSSTDNYKRKYELAKDELAKLHKEGKLKEAEYNNKITELEDQYDNALKNLDNYIDQFARIDLSKVSAEEQRILEMVEQGKIDEAVKAYEELDISNKLRQARANKKALSEAKTKIEAAETKQDEAIAELTEKQKREMATLKLAGGKDNYDKVARMLKENALADTTNINEVREYALFAFDQKNYKEAERFYLICLNGCDDIGIKAQTLDNLGLMYYRAHDYSKAEKHLLKALEIYAPLFAQNPDDYRSKIANNYNNLGILYYSLNDYAKAEKYLFMASENYTQLFSQNPDNYRNDLADTQHNLGILYDKYHEYDKAEEYLLKALDYRMQMFTQTPETYRKDLALTQLSVGICYTHSQDYVKAEENLLKALENYTQLFARNPDGFLEYLAMTQKELGDLYLNLHNDIKAEEFYLKALENSSVLFTQNPDTYRETLSTIQNNFGVLYNRLQNKAKAEEYYLKALEISTQLFAQEPEVYRRDLANNQYNLGHLYFELHEYSKAEDYGLKALENHLHLFTQAPDAYREDLANNYHLLGWIYCILNDDRSEEYLLKALEQQTLLLTTKPDADRSNLANIQYLLGRLYNRRLQFSEAEGLLLKALENYTQLFTQKPDGNLANLANVQNELGVLYVGTEDYAKAEEFLLKALKNRTQLFSQDSETYRADLSKTQNSLALMYSITENYSKAEEYYVKALENYTQLFNQDPETYRTDLASIQYCLGEISILTEDVEKAEKYYLMAMEHSDFLSAQQTGTDRDLLFSILYGLMDIYAKDETKIDRYDAVLDKAFAYGEEIYEKDKAFQSTIVDLRIRKGYRYLLKGNTDEGLALFESTYKLDPEASAPYLARGCNSKAYEYVKADDYTKALEMIDRAITLQPGDANYYDTKGEILLMKGDTQGAVGMWHKVLELNPDFLGKQNGETELHRQLKEKGLINN